MKSKKLLAILLTLCMFLTFLPGTALATPSGVAQVGTTVYPTLEAALDAVGDGETVIELLANATLDYGARDTYGTSDTTKVTIDGNGKVLTLHQTDSDWSSIGLLNTAATLAIQNVSVLKTTVGGNGAWNNHAINFSSKIELTSISFNNAIALGAGATLDGVTITETGEYYGIWIEANGQTVTINNTTVTANASGGRGIKISDQYITSPAPVTLSVSGSAFTTAKKSAIIVGSTAGANIALSSINIVNVAADTTNAVWVDEGWAAYANLVTVTGGTKIIEGTVAVAQIGTTGYPTLEEAVAAAANGDTVELLTNVTLSSTLTIESGKTVTLELNGCTISQTNLQTAAYSMIQNNGTLTIMDSGSTGKISYTDSGTGGEYISDAITNRGTLTVESGTIESLSDADVANLGYPHAIDNMEGTLIINGGTVSNNTYSAIRIWCDTSGSSDVIINGGIINGAVDLHNVSANQNVGSLTITGGTFNKTANDNTLRLVNFGADLDEITAEISGGTFNGGIGIAGTVKGEGNTYLIAVFSISGGSFSTDPTAYILSGATVTGTGPYVVGGPAARIGTTGYATLEAAVAAVPTDGTQTTITLMSDVTLSFRLDITGGKNITLDLNGKTISKGSMPIRVDGGTLNVIGTGTIQETLNDQYSPIVIKGSTTSTNINYSNVTIGENVTLKGWAGLFIDQVTEKAYGVNVTFNGTIQSPGDGHTTAGHGIYVNGSIKDSVNAPNISIGATAVITSAGTGIYAAGYANWTIAAGAEISGGTSAIEVKGGQMTINGGTITTTADPSQAPNNNGGSTYGYALAVVDNIGYSGAKVTVNGGTFNGPVALLDDDDITSNNVCSLSISGGTFDSDPSAYIQSDKAISTETTAGYFVVVDRLVNVSATTGLGTSPLLDNTAVKQFGDTGIQNMTGVVDKLQVVLTAESGASVTYNVTPMLASTSVTTTTTPITFRLAVPSTWTGAVKVTHTHGTETTITYHPVLGTAPNKYIELSSAQFSSFVIDSQTDAELAAAGYVARTASTAYTTVAEAFTAAVTGDTITLLKDCGGAVEVAADKTITLALNGKTFSGSVSNSGTLYVSGTGVIAATGTYNSDVTTLINSELVNCTLTGSVWIVTAKTTSVYSINADATATDKDAATAGLQVYAGDTVTVNVTVNGGTYVGAAAKFTYDIAKFTLAALPTGWELTGTPGTLRYYSVRNSGYDVSGTVIGTFTFTAKAFAADGQTGTFSFETSSTFVATMYSEGYSTVPAIACGNNSDSVTIILMPMPTPTITGFGNIVYDGNAHSITVSNTPTGAAVTYSNTVDGTYTSTNPSYTNVSNNTVYFKITCDGYETYIGWATLNITPRSVAVVWNAAASYTYNGLTQTAPTASFEGVGSDDTITCTVVEDASKPFKNADTYNYTASTSNTNYTLTNTTKTVTIAPLSVAVTWAGTGNRTYNGAAQTYPTATIAGAASEGTISCTVTKTETADFTELGTYNFTATLANTNYTLTGTTAAVTIDMPVYASEVTAYASGYNLLLIYSNDTNTAFTYDGAKLFNVSGSGYKYANTTAYTNVFATIIGAEYDSNDLGVTTIADVAGTISYTSPLDVNSSSSVDIRDAVAVQSVYNGRSEYFTGYLAIVLKADVNHDKVVNASDFSLIKAQY